MHHSAGSRPFQVGKRLRKTGGELPLAFQERSAPKRRDDREPARCGGEPGRFEAVRTQHLGGVEGTDVSQVLETLSSGSASVGLLQVCLAKQRDFLLETMNQLNRVPGWTTVQARQRNREVLLFCSPGPLVRDVLLVTRLNQPDMVAPPAEAQGYDNCQPCYIAYRELHESLLKCLPVLPVCPGVARTALEPRVACPASGAPDGLLGLLQIRLAKQRDFFIQKMNQLIKILGTIFQVWQDNGKVPLFCFLGPHARHSRILKPFIQVDMVAPPAVAQGYDNRWPHDVAYRELRGHSLIPGNDASPFMPSIAIITRPAIQGNDNHTHQTKNPTQRCQGGAER